MDTDRPRFISKGTVIAVVATTVPGLLQAITPATPTMAILLGLIITLSLGISTFAVAWAERQPGLRPIASTLALYGVAVCAALYLSNGYAFLVAMPFTSMVVLYLPLRFALLAETGLVVFMGGLVIPRVAADTKQLAGFVSSVGFVFVFSLIAHRERYARRDVERLNQQVAELATIRERNRIAREIHDSLGHYLTVANVQLEAARRTERGPQPAGRRAAAARLCDADSRRLRDRPDRRRRRAARLHCARRALRRHRHHPRGAGRVLRRRAVERRRKDSAGLPAARARQAVVPHGNSGRDARRQRLSDRHAASA